MVIATTMMVAMMVEMAFLCFLRRKFVLFINMGDLPPF